MRRSAQVAAAFLAATAVWLPCLGFLFRPSLSDYRAPTGVSIQTFTVLAFANIALRSPTETEHYLDVVNPAFAADQYRRAKAELGRSLLGFGYAREWPASWVGVMDVDSGPVIPPLGISAGSSGMAFVGDSTREPRL